MNALARCLSLFAASLLVACGGGKDAAPATAVAASSPYVAQARGRVDTATGLLRVAAPGGGVVERWLVDVGDSVKPGQLMVVLQSREARAAQALAQAEVAHAQAQLKALASRLPALRERARRLRQAAQADAGSPQAADDAREAVTEAEQQVAVQRAAVAVVRQRAAEARQAVAQANVHAPAAGQVVQRLVQAGEAVEPRGALAQLLPAGPLIVRAELNEAWMDRVRVGMKAEVLPAAADGPVTSATVLRIGAVLGPLRGAEVGAAEPVPTDSRAVECVLELHNAPLRAGQRVLVRFLP